MLKGYAINQKRLEYLEKTIKLIDIANRIDERLEGNDAKEILKVIGGYSKALNLLDDYDHRTLKKFEGNIDDSESYFAGENGTIIMCEHDYMNNFKRLGELKNGDIIEIQTNYGDFYYELYDEQIVLETETDKLPIQKNEEILMLYTCYNMTGADKTQYRYVVYAKKV
jgi:sortase A